MKTLDEFIEKHSKIITFVIITIGVLMYAGLLVGNDIWEDEAYSLALVQHPFAELCKITALDVHPPLYYILMKCFTAFVANKIFMAKLFSIIPAIIILFVGNFQLTKLFNKKTALVFLITYITFPYIMEYSVDIRMYSWAQLFVFLTGLFAYRAYKEEKLWLWFCYAIAAVASAYTHYFAFVAVIFVSGFLFIAILKNKRQLLVKWIIFTVISIILYVPWVSAFISQLKYKVDNGYWIDPIVPGVLFLYVRQMFGAAGIPCLFAFTLAGYAAALISLLMSKNKKLYSVAILALLVPICTTAVGVGASIAVRPVFIVRYAIPCVPIMLVFLSLGVAHMKTKELVGAILAVSIVGGAQTYGLLFSSEFSKRGTDVMQEFANKYDCDSYVFYAEGKYDYIIPLIAYYNPEADLYTPWTIGGDMPYENYKSIDDFKPEEHDNVILFVNVDEPVPSEYSTVYKCEYLERFDNDHYNFGIQTFDVYKLTKN